ncbi:MAG: hypothetical protein IJ899_14740 [Blautia sp.]|nr:hypothetical protein [Blautia sp.]
MEVKHEMTEIDSRLEEVQLELEGIVKDYQDNCTTYGWDNFSETLATAAAQIYMQRIVCRNATVKKEWRL